MRLIVYCKDYAPLETGFSSAFRGLCEALGKLDEVHVHVVTPTPLDGKQEAPSEGVRVTRLPHAMPEDHGQYAVGQRGRNRLINSIFSVINRAYWSSELARICRSERPDLLLIESGDDPLVTAFLPDDVMRKVAIRFHSTGDTESARYRSGIFAKIERAAIRFRIAPRLHAVLSTNPYHLDFIRSFYYSDNPLALAKRYFANIENVVAESSSSGQLSPTLSQTSIARRIVTLGRMDEGGIAQKGISDLLFGFAELAPVVRQKLSLTVIGDGPGKASLQNIATQLALENVHFVGRLPNKEVRALLESSSVVALVSRFEGRSMFAIEGMLAGCAVIFTDTGGISDLVDGNGWRVPVQDIDALARALTELAATSSTDLARMGERSRQIADSMFDSNIVSVSALRKLRIAAMFLDATKAA